MKIIAGKFKGRVIVSPKSDVRPVSELARKACFDILGQEVRDKSVLDLFAGSGALGLEAISRGAAKCVLIDHDPDSAAAIISTINSLQINELCEFYRRDAFGAASDLARHDRTFDLIFLDPPYYQGLLTKALQSIKAYGILSPLGLLVCFGFVKDEFPGDDADLELLCQRTYGKTALNIYQLK